MKNKCALLIGALAFISALLIIPNYKAKCGVTADFPQEYSSYSNIGSAVVLGTDLHNCKYTWGMSYPSDQMTPSDNFQYCGIASSNLNSGDSIYGKSLQFIDYGSYVTIHIANNNDVQVITHIISNPNVSYLLYNNHNYYTINGVRPYTSSGYSCVSAWSGGSQLTGFSNYTTAFTSISEALTHIQNKFRSISVYYEDTLWIYPDDLPFQYGIMNTNKGLKVNGADFSFYSSYTNNKFTIAYNYTLTNRDSSDSNLRIEAGDLLTFELYAKVPTNEFVEHYISENGLGDATPSIILDVARTLKNTTNIINTPSIPTTTIYGLNYYGYNEDDAVEYDDAFYNFEYGNDQNGILTFRVDSSNNSSSSPNLLSRLVAYYGSEREAIIGSALGYIDYCRSYVINVSSNGWNVYNPYYTYFFQVKDDSGRNVIRANSFEGTPQQFTADEVDDREDVGGFTIPANNPSDIQSSYTGGITNSYNNTYNNYYNTSDANQELLDYLYRYRDGGQQEDIQNAYGYLNSTIDSVSNVPVVIGKLFYGFFPPEVILLFNAMFIIFAVFIIIKIIRHLFL